MARPLQGWSAVAMALQGRLAVARDPTGVVDCCQGRLQAQPLATRATANRRDRSWAWLAPVGAGACGCRQQLVGAAPACKRGCRSWRPSAHRGSGAYRKGGCPWARWPPMRQRRRRPLDEGRRGELEFPFG
ncbi:hypothetical protein GW17_00057172 [Ensete ventricosum]|nr:hypothetical protein GW17_00057172 [Ensete ventricosum]